MPDSAHVYVGVVPFAEVKYRADSGIAGAAAPCVARALL
jgi:hypothetical protein